MKKQWDKDSWEGANIKAVLLGPASLLIQQGLSESLAGRFELIHMPHWPLPEMEKDRQVIAIEVKSGLRRKARGIDVFVKKYQPYKALMVGSEGLPWQQFLALNPLELFD